VDESLPKLWQAPDGVETAIVIGAQNAVLVAWPI
jgi:hypothetical protein